MHGGFLYSPGGRYPQFRGTTADWWVRPFEAIGKSTIAGISVFASVETAASGFLRMRGFLNAVKELPHAEGARRACLEARTAAM
jgi:hypothetical protein